MKLTDEIIENIDEFDLFEMTNSVDHEDMFEYIENQDPGDEDLTETLFDDKNKFGGM